MLKVSIRNYGEDGSAVKTVLHSVAFLVCHFQKPT